MKPEIIRRFKTLFETQKRNLLYTNVVIREDFLIKPEDLSDETDQTSSDLENAMRMRLRNREALFLKKIEESLARIADGSFGKCVDCDEDIDVRRLEARPTATLCVHCKEEREHREQGHIDGHRAKSLGTKIRFA